MKRAVLLAAFLSLLSALPVAAQGTEAWSPEAQKAAANVCIQIGSVHLGFEEFIAAYPERERTVHGLLDQLTSAGSGSVRACPSNCTCWNQSGNWVVSCVQGGCGCMIAGSSNNGDLINTACICA
ncbi:MAG TPA: hypothetical protein VGX68_22610 [Thermoanaerobaculia bacterium]|jgi:hypothetical protein|nr:hypothetical protein [Thermoanaerobaculia bacterium]